MAPIATTYSRVDPRARGGDRTTSGRYIVQGGRSPRTRGRPLPALEGSEKQRSIPAHAGETCRILSAVSAVQVDPRARGGDDWQGKPRIGVGGRSPRTRGRPTRPIARLKAPGSIPAHAGETWSADLAPPIRGVDPRARGGDEYRFLEDERVYGRSPRTRGRLVTEGCYSDYRRSIPAHAGETKK